MNENEQFHPMRCETCNDLLKCKPGEILYVATRRKGCASHSEMTRKYDTSLYYIGESEIDAGRNALINLMKMGGLEKEQIAELKVISEQFRTASNHPFLEEDKVRNEVLDEIEESLSCEYYDDMTSAEGGCIGTRNGEICKDCGYYKVDISQLKSVIESLRKKETD